MCTQILVTHLTTSRLNPIWKMQTSFSRTTGQMYRGTSKLACITCTESAALSMCAPFDDCRYGSNAANCNMFAYRSHNTTSDQQLFQHKPRWKRANKCKLQLNSRQKYLVRNYHIVMSWSAVKANCPAGLTCTLCGESLGQHRNLLARRGLGDVAWRCCFQSMSLGASITCIGARFAHLHNAHLLKWFFYWTS